MSPFESRRADLARRWNFQVQKLLRATADREIWLVHQGDGLPAILKIHGTRARAVREVAWLNANAQISPKIFEFDPDLGAFLIENLAPGHSLKDLYFGGDDDSATRILAGAIRGFLPAADATVFQPLTEVVEVFVNLSVVLNRSLLNQIHGRFAAHTQNPADWIPLHGDLHQENMILGPKGWTVIDPHGYFGPRAFEIGAMIRNPIEDFPFHRDWRRLLRRRLAILREELPFMRDEIRDWAFLCTALSLAWTYEDEGILAPEKIAIVEALLEMD